ncbi:hypothetical protein Taro_042967, partial [Colocasia esculenta]|nr:hypothetical protein [Colocasia esculenta]
KQNIREAEEKDKGMDKGDMKDNNVMQPMSGHLGSQAIVQGLLIYLHFSLPFCRTQILAAHLLEYKEDGDLDLHKNKSIVKQQAHTNRLAYGVQLHHNLEKAQVNNLHQEGFKWIYSEMIGNVMIDARSTGKYYHCKYVLIGDKELEFREFPVLGVFIFHCMEFSHGIQYMCAVVRLMGRAASHITLECALQTHPNITLIGEEVAAKRQTLKNVTEYITDIICKRAELGYNYGVILIPEGLIDFIPEVQQLISELNEILAHDVVDEGGLWKKKLRNQSQLLFELLPQAIQEQLLLERDPHGNVARIETEKMLIQMVEAELEKRKEEGAYKREFKGQSHFFGYEGRCGLPTNFDSTYCYALGFGAGALLHSGKTGLISSVGNLAAPVDQWTVGGTALTSLMDVERRHGKFKPVIKKAMVELEGAPFRKFASMRDEWALSNRYISPGPIQFIGPSSDAVNHTLLLELGACA